MIENGGLYPADAEMPFVAIRENGGPYDGPSFVAGFRLGVLDALIAASGQESLRLKFTDREIQQADLIAMRHDWCMHAEPSRDMPGLVACTFHKGRPV